MDKVIVGPKCAKIERVPASPATRFPLRFNKTLSLNDKIGRVVPLCGVVQGRNSIGVLLSENYLTTSFYLRSIEVTRETLNCTSIFETFHETTRRI